MPNNWIRAAAGCGFVLALTLAFVNENASGDAEKSATMRAKVGQPAPDFTLLDCEGEKHTLSSLKDQIVVLEWVNQQCPWSVKAIPEIKRLVKKFKDKGVVWVGVESTHWRKPEENVKYARDQQLAFKILMDNDGRVGKMYSAKTTPHMYVIARGKLVYAGALHNDQYGRKPDGQKRNYVEEALNALLAGKEVPVSETTPWGCSVKYKK
jgi:peroxiredoxin